MEFVGHCREKATRDSCYAIYKTFSPINEVANTTISKTIFQINVLFTLKLAFSKVLDEKFSQLMRMIWNNIQQSGIETELVTSFFLSITQFVYC